MPATTVSAKMPMVEPYQNNIVVVYTMKYHIVDKVLEGSPQEIRSYLASYAGGQPKGQRKASKGWHKRVECDVLDCGRKFKRGGLSLHKNKVHGIVAR